MGNKHTINELYQMQSLSLSSKIRMTNDRIISWVEEYGIDGVYISFSGGKDSTVLLDLCRKLYPDMKAVFVDTGLEYPEIRQFVKTFDNVDWIKPKLTFKQVIGKYGYPFITKEVSECVYCAKKYFEAEKDCINKPNRKIPYKNNHDKLMGYGKYSKDSKVRNELPEKKNYSRFNCERYKFFLEDGAPPISNICCNVMKKRPLHTYNKQKKRNAITGQMACENRYRSEQWMRNGCNGFNMKSPISNPIAFWTDQDTLYYIKDNDLPICSVYGEITEDYATEGIIEGQMNLSDFGLFEKDNPVLTTTGCKGTGCIFCGFGVHLEKSPNRFEKLSVTHPKLFDYVFRGGAFNEKGEWNPDNRGLGYWYCVEWINKHGHFNIKYPNRKHYIETYMNEETEQYLK